MTLIIITSGWRSDQPRRKKEWVRGGKKRRESYLSENSAAISSVQATDTLLRDDTVQQTNSQPQSYTSFHLILQATKLNFSQQIKSAKS